MTITSSPTPDIQVPNTDAYVVIGLATCFIKAEGEVEEVQVLEPIPSAALETLIKGVPTSYQWAFATTLGAVVTDGQPQSLAEFPSEARFGDEFCDRAIAAARTYERHRDIQSVIPPGTLYREFNYSTERKRVLNRKRVVRTEDNVKQHAHTHKVL